MWFCTKRDPGVDDALKILHSRIESLEAKARSYALDKRFPLLIQANIYPYVEKDDEGVDNFCLPAFVMEDFLKELKNKTGIEVKSDDCDGTVFTKEKKND